MRNIWKDIYSKEVMMIKAVAPRLKDDITPILQQMERTHRAQIATQFVKQMGGVSDNSNISNVYHF